ncbi:MAG TPA: SpoIIE family protein phosphatase [Acidimicrobiales bacterium]|nr:SpoIIE family protein phosphatase [Acidimicrobiales bacterium]
MPDQPLLDWAIARRPVPGEVDCGDVATVLTTGARMVMAVIDGLGHGAPAARSASLAAEAIEKHEAEPPDVLLRRTHEALMGTRGAAATVAVVDGPGRRLDWLGVGNVDGVLVRADRWARPAVHGVFLAAGVLGDRLPVLFRPGPITLSPGDRLVLATDGIRADLAEVGRSELQVDRLARKVLADAAIPDDDALVLVASVRGGGGAR